MDTSWLVLDLRYEARLLRKSSAFTITAVLSLAIGIGMNTAIFSLLDAVLLWSLPVRRSGIFSFSSPAFAALKENDTLTGLSAFRPWRFRTTLRGDPQLANGQLVSGDYFPLLGVRALLGRTLTEQDNQFPGAHPVPVLSFRYWQREFNSDSTCRKLHRFLTQLHT